MAVIMGAEADRYRQVLKKYPPVTKIGFDGK